MLHVENMRSLVTLCGLRLGVYDAWLWFMVVVAGIQFMAQGLGLHVHGLYL